MVGRGGRGVGAELCRSRTGPERGTGRDWGAVPAGKGHHAGGHDDQGTSRPASVCDLELVVVAPCDAMLIICSFASSASAGRLNLTARTRTLWPTRSCSARYVRAQTTRQHSPRRVWRELLSRRRTMPWSRPHIGVPAAPAVALRLHRGMWYPTAPLWRRSSVGQSSGIIIRVSGVRIPAPLPEKLNLGFLVQVFFISPADKN